jgi:regulator of sigma E protease
VGGPVSIFVMLYLMVRASFSLALWFTGFLNVNLALVNLLPLPVLDGGHIILNLWAWITRRPIPAAVVRWLVNLFGVLLILLFVTLTIRDSKRQLLPALRARFAPDAPAQPPAAP